MNIWEILGVDMADELAVIRSAYARKLKVCHPEDDPDGFQRLREAYEQAIKYTKIRAQIAAAKAADGANEKADKGKDINDKADKKDQQDLFRLGIHLDEFAFQKHSRDNRTAIKEFFESVLVLYDDFYARIEIGNWKKVLHADQLWDMNLKEEIRWDVLRFLLEHPVLPQSVWQLMDSEFHWTDSSMQPPYDCASAVSILMREIDPKWDLSFAQFHKDENAAGQPDEQKNNQIDFPLYAQCRRNLKDAIVNDQYEKAEGYYYQAVIVFDNDPDIYRIYFEYLNEKLAEGKKLPDKDLHLTISNRLIKLYPDNHIYLIKRADLCLNIGFYETAIVDYKRLLVMCPDNMEIPFHLADAYSKIGRRGQKVRNFIWICKRYLQVQKRLRRKKDHSIDNIALEKQIEANKRVFEQNTSTIQLILSVCILCVLFALGIFYLSFVGFFREVFWYLY